jgi:hypothetical protein
MANTRDATSRFVAAAVWSWAMRERLRVADFWDGVVRSFLDGEFPLPEPLDRWVSAYAGRGEGEVDRQALPEPYSGPLLDEARAIFLGLNPGVAIPAYQYRDGVLAREIRMARRHYDVYRTTPANREPWLTDFGPNRHHLNRVAFMRRWAGDESLGDEHMLTFELYPWHSRRVTAPVRPEPDIIQSMIFAPIAETGVRHVFAFGSPWFGVLDRLGLPCVLRLGAGGEPYGSSVASRAISVYEQDGFYIVAERHSGSAGPPSASETRALKEALIKHAVA